MKPRVNFIHYYIIFILYISSCLSPSPETLKTGNTKTENSPTNILIFGLPGSGKTTQSRRLTENYDCCIIYLGELLRNEVARKTDLGKLVSSYMKSGEIIPNDISLKIMTNEIEKNTECALRIFDGYPRSLEQSQQLDSLLLIKNTSVHHLIHIDTEDSTSINRIMLRKAGGSQREDDTSLALIKKRIEIYKKDTNPVLEYYRKKGVVHLINGNKSEEEVYQEIQKVIPPFVR